VWVTDLDSNLLYANRSMVAVLESSLEDMTGKKLVEIFPVNGAEYTAHAQHVLREKMAFDFEESFHYRGQDLTIVSHMFPMRDKHGGIYGVAGVSSNITDYRHREKMLYNAGVSVSSLPKENVYDEIVRRLTSTLGVDLAFIGKLQAGSITQVETESVCRLGEIIPQMQYSLAGTPCQSVVGKDFKFVPDRLGELYPNDGMVDDLQLQSYAGYPLFDGRGMALGMVAVVHTQPISDPDFFESILKIYSIRIAAELERERSNQALLASEEQYRGIFNASADALIFWNAREGIVDVNPAAEQLYGYSREEFLALDGRNLMSGEHQDQMLRFEQHALEQVNFSERIFNVHRDGQLFPVEVHGVHMQYQGQSHLLTIVRDVSEQAAREAALKSSESRLRASIEAALDAVICMDEAGCITEFNHSAEMTFGYARAQVLGQTLADLIIPERFRERHRQGLERYLQSGDFRMLGRRVEITAQRSDGSEFPTELAIDVHAAPDGRLFIGYLRDLSEKHKAEEAREQLEKQLRQAQKMEAIGQLTGGIAHDFNNILTSLMGYVSMAEDQADQEGDEKLLRYMSRARRSGEKARDLIQQMLTFSRGQKGEVQSTHLPNLVREFMSLLESTLPSSVEISTNINDKVPALSLDPVQIEQVLMNLCINARDAMENAGELAISLNYASHEAVCSSCQQNVHDHYVELSVSDNGPGIPKQTLERMFEPFFTTKDIGKGSGMGLAMVHGIVHEFGGHVVVDTSPGKGTNFRILLPCSAGASSSISNNEDHAEVALVQPLRGQILLVDDEPSVAEFMQDLLESWGLEVDTYHNSPRALEAVCEHRDKYQMAILDQTMANMSGLELVREMRRKHCDIPVIIYTGYSEEIDQELAAQEDILALLAKPIDTDKLQSLLRDHL
jgi:PAS domain S-box-containing protein